MTVRLIMFLMAPLFYSSIDLEAQWTRNEARSWQKEMNVSFRSETESPLEDLDRIKFKRLPFFKINKKFALSVKWERCNDSAWFKMTTTTERRPIYRKYANLYFSIGDDSFKLTAFQPQSLFQKEGWGNYLFIPFGDESNGNQTYGGGRYVEIRIDLGKEQVLLDFNKSYNPYCAYSERYSCPKIPIENILDIKINAGVKYPANKYHH